MMNPQFPGQYGQGPPTGYGPPGQGQPPPGGQAPMYNGQPGYPGGGQYGGPGKPGPVQNGPPQPGQNTFSGPQGDSQYGPRPGGPPGMFQPGGQAPPGMTRPPQPHMGLGAGPPNAAKQITNQMGGMNLGGQPSPSPDLMGRGTPTQPGPGQRLMGPPGMMGPPSSGPPNMGPPGSAAPPSSSAPQMGGGYNSGPPSSNMGPPSSMGASYMGQPTGMAPPLNSGPGMGPPSNMGPPSSMGPGMAPPSSMGPGMAPISNMGPGMAPPSSMAPGMAPPSSMAPGMAPPSSMGPGMAPPSSMGHPSSRGPPTSMGSQGGYGQGPAGGYSQPPMPGGAPPSSGGYGPAPTSTGPPTSVNRPPTSYPGGMPPPSSGTQSGFGPPTGMDMRQPSSQPGMPPPPSSMGNAPGMYPNQQPGFPGQQPGPGPYPQPGGQNDMTYPAGPHAPTGPYNQGYGAGPTQINRPPSMQPPVQQKKLDVDQMPSPIQVIEDDKRNRSGVFTSSGKGTVPPLVTTPFYTQDQGNSNPSFIRSTMYNVPCTSDLLKNSHIPFSITVSPFAKLQPEENPPPVVNLGELGPVRCKRCKAYMNPNMMFIDGGRRFQCVFCGAATDVPNEYFAHLDHTGRRVDSYDRPELCLGSYEFVATKDYCKNSVLPKEPAFIFMIDVSYNSVKSGLVHLICEKLKSEILVNLPKDVGAEKLEIRVGFVTYSKEIHFYNVKGSLAQPQMLVVSDLEDVFVPLLEGFLVTLDESEAVIDSLLAQIPLMFADSRETETVLGPVIQAGLDALKSADRSGKLYIFHTSLPIAEAPGKLKNRDDRKLLGSDKEKTILTPQTKFYSSLGQECVAAGCSVDMFLFPNSYCDVATISDICRLTSGNMYKYSYFQADLDGGRFIEDLKNNIQSQYAFDAIVRVRTSQGIRPVDFFGNFYMSNTTDVEMCAVDSNQALCVEVKHDDKLSEQDGAYVQVAVLYTSIGGQRRLRTHNLALSCCTQLADLFRNCELDTTINYMSKFALRNVLNKSPREVREHIMNQVANILACYRKNCASPSSPGQLILPECMKLLPLYGNCVIKCDGIQGGQDISTDDRSYLMHLINSMDVKTSSAFFYPRLVPLHELSHDRPEIPAAMRCSSERLKDNGVYLLENGVSMFLWIGHNASPDWIQKVFSVQSAAQIDIDKSQLLDLENETSHLVREIIEMVRKNRNRYMKLTIIRQRDKLEPWFNHFLVEDKGSNNSASYVDFLCHIHKEIRNLLA